jgi:hypothetical protein
MPLHDSVSVEGSARALTIVAAIKTTLNVSVFASKHEYRTNPSHPMSDYYISPVRGRNVISQTMPDPDALSLRPTMIGGETHPDDYQVIWNCIPIGRILKQPGVPVGRPNWHWGVAFPGRAQPPGHRGH